MEAVFEAIPLNGEHTSLGATRFLPFFTGSDQQSRSERRHVPPRVRARLSMAKIVQYRSSRTSGTLPGQPSSSGCLTDEANESGCGDGNSENYGSFIHGLIGEV